MLSKKLKGDLYPLLRLIGPLILSGTVGSAVVFFETVFLARLNQDALAAGALVSWLFGLFGVIAFGTLGSINILVSHKHGAQDLEGIARVFRDGGILAVLFSIPVFILFWNMGPLLLLLGQKPHIVALANLYLHGLVWGILPTLIGVAGIQFIIGLGHARVIVFFMLLSTIISLFFSFTLIFGQLGMPALGIAGAGWGTAIGSWVVALTLVGYIGFKQEYRLYVRHLFSIQKPFFIGELLKIGLPMGLMFCFEVGFFFALTLVMGALGGEMFLAANQIAMQYMGAVIGVIFSIAQGITVRMGYLLGSGDQSGAKRAAYIGVMLSMVFMSLFACIDWFYPDCLIAIDLDLTDPHNLPLITLIKQILIVSALVQIFEAIRLSLFGALRALKDTRFTLISSVLCFWGIALPVGYFLATSCQYGGPGLWWGMVFGAIISALLLFMRFQHKIASTLIVL